MGFLNFVVDVVHKDYMDVLVLAFHLGVWDKGNTDKVARIAADMQKDSTFSLPALTFISSKFTSSFFSSGLIVKFSAYVGRL